MSINESKIRRIIREEAAKVLREGFRSRRSYDGGYSGGGRGGTEAMIQHLMDKYGYDREDAEQRLADIEDDIGFDRGLVDDAVYGDHDDD